MIVTKKSGFYIIGDALIILKPGTEVSYPSSKKVQSFATEADARAAHKVQFPQQYKMAK